MEKNIDAEITAVTVYTDRAFVTRQNKISLTGDESELILSKLPVTLIKDSIRVTGKGTSTVNILGVKVESVFTPEVPVESIAQLDRQMQALQNQKASLENQLSSRQLQLNFVAQLSEKSKTQYAINLSKQQTNLEQAQALLDFVGDKHLHYGNLIIELKQQQQDINNQISVLKQQKQNLLVPKNKEYFNLIIFMEVSEPGEFELEVAYLVNRASWRPLYDLKVDTQAKQLNLAYLAEVKQSTGEDWQNVALVLSTAKPGLGTLPPKLQPWYIDANKPVTVASPKARKMRASNEFDSAEAFSISAVSSAPMPSPKTVPANTVAATVANSGSVITFDVSGSGNIPSDGTPYKVTIFSDRYPARLEYVAIPRLVSFTYLQAVITNPATGVTLLPGKANILREQTFVGTTTLENIAPSQEFTLNLGIDEKWKIERNLVQRQVDKKLIGNKKRVTYAYRLIVNNLQARENSLKLTEQLPVSRDENIKVRLIQAEPKIKLGEMGILEWNLNLPEGSKQEINYQFTLEYPPEVSLSGLNI
ncbi:MAG: mucoidy inhibitor MuiA family protein [Xenococcaceae cyanobacterium MO_188.B29]|nr:mucoidy inhibitor MuiA family protein [Xenococcaceae cyanobacterium MO_188.B29]